MDKKSFGVFNKQPALYKKTKETCLSIYLLFLRFKKRSLEFLSAFFIGGVFKVYLSIKRKLFLLFSKKDTNLEAKHRRYERRGSASSFIRRAWNSAYESGKLAGVLQPTPRERKEKEEIERINRLKNLYESESFKLFLEVLKKQEEFVLQELIDGALKSEKLTNNEYVFFLRGQLETFSFIRQKIKSLLVEYALRNQKNRGEMGGGQ